MKIKMILPALAETTTSHLQPVKYPLFRPLGLATPAVYNDAVGEIDLQDEQVEVLNTNDEPRLVIIHVYITNVLRCIHWLMTVVHK